MQLTLTDVNYAPRQFYYSNDSLRGIFFRCQFNRICNLYDYLLFLWMRKMSAFIVFMLLIQFSLCYSFRSDLLIIICVWFWFQEMTKILKKLSCIVWKHNQYFSNEWFHTIEFIIIANSIDWTNRNKAKSHWIECRGIYRQIYRMFIQFWTEMSVDMIWTTVLFTLSYCSFLRTQVNEIIGRTFFTACDNNWMFKLKYAKWILF